MSGKGQNLCTGYIFIYVKWQNLYQNPIYLNTPPDYLCDFNSIRSRERKPYLLQNPGWEIPVTFLARRHIQIKT